jgi:hypothetical protein
MKCFEQSKLDKEAQSMWNNFTDNQKINVYSSYTGIKPKDVDIGGLTYSMLPKYVKLGIKDIVKKKLRIK